MYFCNLKTEKHPRSLLYKMRHKHFTAAILILMISLVTVHTSASALSFDLDSIAAWGKFPNFCIKTYRWGDKFFNSYDSAYVQGTGYKFNVKLKSEAWLDNYVFSLPDDYMMTMASDVNVSAGIHVTYLAVTIGYDYNLMRLFSSHNAARKKFNFGFNCALFAADLYWISNDVGTKLTSFGHKGHVVDSSIPFNGINNNIFGLDVYYFFNNKRYSRAAAFNYSKFQRKSAGSWILGFSYYNQSFNFDFNGLDKSILDNLPKDWAENDYIFSFSYNNYAVRGGYGYNLVLPHNWTLGFSETPIVGVKRGTTNSGKPEVSFSFYNRMQASAIWSKKRIFAGVIFKLDNGLFMKRNQMLLNGVFSGEVSVGYRFNLW